MTTPPEITFAETDLDQIAAAPGRVVVFIGADARLDVETVDRELRALYATQDLGVQLHV